MYTKNNTIISDRTELANYIEGNDVYNASLLIYLNDPRIERVDYTITAFEYRPDLLAKDFYGSTSYQGLFLLQTGTALELLRKGTIVQLIPKRTLDGILGNI